MIEGDVKKLLRAVRGELARGDAAGRFEGVSIDSRTVQPGQLFVCIVGERFDGHDFLAQAFEKKAAGAVVSSREKIPALPPDAPKPFVVQARDTLAALQDLAHCHRNSVSPRVVGVTGTNGKSSTKEMIASVCETKFKTLKTGGNLNNHIGLPLTLLELAPGHEVAVLEMGMSAAGEIRRLAEIARPDIGVITNISEAHLTQLKTVKNVQSAKGELFESLGGEGTAVVNADDPLVLDLARSLRARRITYGIDNEADVRAGNIRPRPDRGFDFDVSMFGKSFPLTLPFLGRFNIYNALAAVATGHSLGVEPEHMAEGLAHCRLLGQRSEIIHHDSMTIINDTYNANPRSMLAALDILVQYRSAGRKFFVMGDMLELDESAPSAHAGIGEEVARLPVDRFVTVGPLAGLAGQRALDAGMERDRVVLAENHEAAADYLSRNARSGDCLLFKGSRGAAMEKAIQGLLKKKAL
ncbi:MAG: UDP-N-acetylmuramoyl-tripeptide--D-alanyl-D-alanine ligase [Nitrospinae bacterium]|nr:UDP-N-acetylmuramoyl-tripeptide--D-alanyl-D-alanine ligase [Nitrospinota bacterium]